MTTDEQPPEHEGIVESEPVPSDESSATLATQSTESAHPYRERYLVPFVFPLMIVIGVVFYVLNVSRLFLASKGTAALVLASVMTGLILFGAAALSAAPKMRTPSVGLILVGALVVIGGGGWVVVGHSEEKKAAAIVLPAPVGSMEVTVPSGQLKFDPNTFKVPFDSTNPYTAIVVKYHDEGAAQHTLEFQDQTVVWNLLEITKAGQVAKETAGFPKQGDYTFFCTIPGHQAAGMQGTVTVTNSLKPQKVASSGSTTTTG
jgi:uncharacterized cupredoxin-like copper-binding protein